mgnify:CR=1 FL=1
METDANICAVPVMIGNVMRVLVSIPASDGAESRTVEYTVQVTGLRWCDCNGYLIPVFDAFKLNGVWEQTQPEADPKPRENAGFFIF